mgnify:FL=1
MPRSIQELTDLIAELPGIGPRQARRVVQYLLRANPGYRAALAKSIANLATEVSVCTQCFRYDETVADLCRICADESRDRSIRMVVEKDVDVDGVEAAGIFHGRYFVLGSLMPLAKQRKSVVAPRIPELLHRIEKDAQDGLSEVILAFATTPEGDYTARELKNKIAEQNSIAVTILGRGLSLGAEIEYADHETLRSALQGRSEKF